MRHEPAEGFLLGGGERNGPVFGVDPADDDRAIRNRLKDLLGRGVHIAERGVGNAGEHFREFDRQGSFMGENDQETERLVAGIFDPVEIPLGNERNVARQQIEVMAFPLRADDTDAALATDAIVELIGIRVAMRLTNSSRRQIQALDGEALQDGKVRRVRPEKISHRERPVCMIFEVKHIAHVNLLRSTIQDRLRVKR